MKGRENCMVESKKRASKGFYGWKVMIGCFVISMVTLGVVAGTVGQYTVAVSDDLGIPRGAFSLSITVMNLVICFANILFGFFLKIVRSVRAMMLIGVIGMAIGFITYAAATNVFMLCVGGFFLGFLAFDTTAPLSILIANWFEKKQGTALGIVFAGSGVGGVLGSQLVARWITHHGWRMSYVYSLLLMLVLAIPSLLLIKNSPRDVSQLPYGAEFVEEKSETIKIHSLRGVTLREALKLPIFWMVMIVFFLVGICVAPINTNVPGHFETIGMDAETIALIISMIYFVLIFYKIIMGYINDKLGIKAVVLIECIAFAASVAFLILSRHVIAGFIFAVLFGIAYTWLTIPQPLMIKAFFGQKDFVLILGIGIGVMQIAAAVSTTLVAKVYDKTGTYIPAFTFLIIVMLLVIALIFIMFNIHKKR